LGIADSQDGLNQEQCVIDDMENRALASVEIGKGSRRLEGFQNPGFQGAVDMRADRGDMHPFVGRLGC
jgi:hypothetical protein